jgi:hypothetical protein
MNLTRNGKIARLPLAVRQELNRRLDDGEKGKTLVVWLNALPEVQAILAAEFGGRPISEQNLSEWKQGGYRDWVAQREALEVAERLGENATEWKADGRAPLTDLLALWVEARYAVATRRVAETGGQEGWRLLREISGDIVKLRRAEIDQKKLEQSAITLTQRDRQLAMEEERSHRRMADLFTKFYKDERAREILESRGRKGVKMDQLVTLMFGERPTKPTGGAPLPS